jgi:hypothetical protein
VSIDDFTSLVLPGLDYIDRHIRTCGGMDSKSWSKPHDPTTGLVTLVYPSFRIVNSKSAKRDIVPSPPLLTYQLNDDGADHSEIPWATIKNGSTLRIRILSISHKTSHYRRANSPHTVPPTPTMTVGPCNPLLSDTSLLPGLLTPPLSPHLPLPTRVHKTML